MSEIKLLSGSKELSNYLGDEFVILVGSAISGVNTPHLPMVADVMGSILWRASEILSSDKSYEFQLLSRYAAALYCGRYSRVLESTKFEEFLWQIEVATGRDPLNKLLYDLYVCTRMEYGANQSAISWLLQEKKCIGCLTTNFDNSIEICTRNLNLYVHPNYPKTLPSTVNKPILVKLHGDAKSKNCLATIRGLSDARRLAGHQYLRGLISNKKVLVLGYSGFGDVDITPHLELSNAQFVWAVKDLDSRVPNFVKTRILCNLQSTDLSENVLLGLAFLHGWRKKIVGKNHEWKSQIDKWCKQVGIESLAHIVTLTIFGQVGWPSIHLSHFVSLPVVNQEALIAKGIACLQVSAYDSAQGFFNQALSSKKLPLKRLITTRVYLGLAQWRHGNLEEALDTLWLFWELSLKHLRKQEQYEVGDGLRLYLEVGRDWMQYRKMEERKEFYVTRKMENVITRLENMPKADIKGEILAKLVVFHIDHLLGRHVDVSSVEALFEDSFNTKLWGVAEAVGRLLVLISFRKGLSSLVRVDKVLIRRKNWNTVRKSLVAIIHALFREKFPFILNVLDGEIFGKLMTAVRETNLSRKRKAWDKERIKEVVRLY